jgi:ribosomal protein L3 glutamine methyltransferase
MLVLSNYRQQTAAFQSVVDFLRFAVSQAHKENVFCGHGTTNSWDDILSLMLYVLHLDHSVDKIIYEAKLTEDEKVHFLELVEKRVKQRIPTPYLTNKAYFCGLEFFVDERVLIPRSPIAEMIQAQFAPWVNAEQVSAVLDLCTGSGCIAMACCYAFEDAKVDAVDISEHALEVAKINQQALQLEKQLTLYQSDLFEALAGKKYDIIVSNPPYVTRSDMQQAPAEFQHEPKLALEAGEDGLELVDKILIQAADYLNEEGILVVEVGVTCYLLEQKYKEVPFTWLEFESDAGGVFLLTKEQLLQYFSN